MEERLFIRCVDHDIPIVIEYPDEGSFFPCVLMLHGFMAYKEGDGYLFRKLAKKLKDNGIVSARIDFASMGENRYSRRNYSLHTMIKETKTVFEYLRKNSSLNKDKIGILGHSLGGRVAFLCADLNSKCIVTLNGAINIKDEAFLEKLIPFDFNKEYEIIKTSDGREELLFSNFFIEGRTCLNEKIYDYRNPILVCVASDDPTIEPQIGYQFVQDCGMDNVELMIIQNTNHTFHAKTDDITKVNELADKLNVWLDHNLKI